MKIDLDTYLASKQLVISLFEKNKKSSYSRIISTVSVTTMVPVIVVAFWLGEQNSWPEEVIESIKRNQSFYGYTEIKNKPINSPI
jgi:hypothetical protein